MSAPKSERTASQSLFRTQEWPAYKTAGLSPWGNYRRLCYKEVKKRDRERTTPILLIALFAHREGTALLTSPKFERCPPHVSGNSRKPFPSFCEVFPYWERHKRMRPCVQPTPAYTQRVPRSPCLNKDHSKEKPFFPPQWPELSLSDCPFSSGCPSMYLYQKSKNFKLPGKH